MSPWADQLFHAVIAAAGAGIFALLWYIVRLLVVFKDNPPHRHVSGKILYPKGWSPGRIERAE